MAPGWLGRTIHMIAHIIMAMLVDAATMMATKNGKSGGKVAAACQSVLKMAVAVAKINDDATASPPGRG